MVTSLPTVLSSLPALESNKVWAGMSSVVASRPGLVNESLRILIFVMMGILTVSALLMGQGLRRRATPALRWLRGDLREWSTSVSIPSSQGVRGAAGNLHDSGPFHPPSIPDGLGLVHRCRNSYRSELSRTDQPATLDLVCAQIECERIRIPLAWQVPMPAADRWVANCPSLLVSFGLLGTFLGLTLSLADLSLLLKQDTNIQEILQDFEQIISPMGTAFQTSLVGLSLALFVTLYAQFSGVNRISEDLQEVLQTWLDVVVRNEPDSPRYSPVTEAVHQLSLTMEAFARDFGETMRRSIDAALRSKLDEIFASSTVLVQEGQRVMGELNGVTLTMAEAGADFVTATERLRTSRFASELQQAVDGLFRSGEQFTAIGDGLARRMASLRESLVDIQSQWQGLALSAQAELDAARQGQETIYRAVSSLEQADAGLQAAVGHSAEVSTLLNKARKDAKEDREKAQSLAVDLTKRLSADSDLSLAYTALSKGLSEILESWKAQQEELMAIMSDHRREIDQQYDNHRELVCEVKSTFDQSMRDWFQMQTGWWSHQSKLLQELVEAGQTESPSLLVDLQKQMENVIYTIEERLKLLPAGHAGDSGERHLLERVLGELRAFQDAGQS